MDKYQHYEDASCGLLSGLQAYEASASRHLSEPIAVDPENLQRQLEETKVRGRERLTPRSPLKPPREGSEGAHRVSPSGGSTTPVSPIPWVSLYFILLGLHPRHLEFPRPKVKLKLPLLAYATAIATPDP